MMRYLTLLHHPMRNRHGELVTTAVTNMDIHDLARTARTYGMQKFFIVTPIQDQQILVQRIIDHWLSPDSRIKHKDRAEALTRVRVVSTFHDVMSEIQADTGSKARVLMPDAAPIRGARSYPAMAEELAMNPTRPYVLVLGTGWGIAPEFYDHVDDFLDPIFGSTGTNGSDGYNHLSVRAAGAIVCDRLYSR